MLQSVTTCVIRRVPGARCRLIPTYRCRPHGAASGRSPPPSSSRTSPGAFVVVSCESKRIGNMVILKGIHGTQCGNPDQGSGVRSLYTHLSFSSVSFCVLESIRFSPGARGGGGGGGALGTNEGSGGGAGTARNKTRNAPGGRGVIHCQNGMEAGCAALQVGPRRGLVAGRWALEQIAGRWLRALAVIKYNFNLMSLQFVSVVLVCCSSFGSRWVLLFHPRGHAAPCLAVLCGQSCSIHINRG